MTRPLLALLLALSPALAAPGILKGSDPELSSPTIVTNARALGAQDRMEAIATLEDYLATGSDTALMPLVALEAGEQRRLMGDTETAANHFQSVARKYPESPAKEAALLGMALVAFDSGKASGNSLATLRMVPDNLATDTMNADRYRLLALQAKKEEAPQKEVKALAEQAVEYADQSGDGSVQRRVQTDLGDLVPAEITTQVPVEPLSDAADEAALLGAQSALRSGDHAAARAQAQELLATYPDSEYVRAAEWVVMRADAGDPYSSRKVGVLLPLSGKFAPPGKQIRDTLELAFEGSGTELVFYDTVGEPDKAVQGFQELVLKQGVAAVIGPLLQSEAFPVAAEAQAAQVPLVTLSQAIDLSETGEWVFQTAMTPEHQIAGLLDELMGNQGLSKFAIMAPETPYGLAAKESFVEQVMKRGGTVTEIVTYDPAGKDYRADARALGKKNYEDRKNELYRLRKAAEERGEDPSKVVLPPAQDFDAIFIPDSHGRVAMLASALAYEEFAIGTFSPGRGATPVPLVGLNGWHNESLVKGGGKYIEDCVFVDAFNAEDPAVGAFVRTYQSQFGRTPSVVDATAWDTAKLVAVAVGTQAADRKEFRLALAGASLGTPASSGSSFAADGSVERDFYYFTISEGEMHLLGDDPGPVE